MALGMPPRGKAVAQRSMRLTANWGPSGSTPARLTPRPLKEAPCPLTALS